MSTQNVIEGILSQKVVQSGSGYAVKTDIKNIDTVTCNTLNGNISFTNNCGTVSVPAYNNSVSVVDSNITPNSIIIISPTNQAGGNNGFYVSAKTGNFTISVTYTDISPMPFNYFIVKY